MIKKGQFQLSFSMIFSILVIVAILAVSFYVIRFFLSLDACGDIGFYYRGLDDEIEKAWKSQIYSGEYEGSLPSGIEKVCFGNLNYDSAGYSEEMTYLHSYADENKNVFLYPGAVGCDIQLAEYTIEHVEIEGFWCADVSKGKVSVKLLKESGDALVKLSSS